MSDERLVVLLEARISQFEKNLAKARATANRDFKAVEDRSKLASSRIERSMSAVGGRMIASFGAVGAAVGGALSVTAIAAAAKKYVDLTNTLKVAGLEGRELEKVFGGLYQIAQRNGTPIEALATLYSRAAQAQGELKASSADIMKFTDGVSLALRVAGTDATQASGALLQLSQAIGSGTVRAEEFNSVNEGARPILQAVAAGLKEAGGSVSALKTLVTDGKVSSEAFFRAFIAGMPQLEAQVSKTQGTVGQATSRMSNAFVVLVGELDKTTGASEGAAKGLTNVATVIEGMPGYIRAAASSFNDLQSWLTKAGNHPVWEKLGRMMGLKYTWDEFAASGMADPKAPTPTRTGRISEFALSPEGRAPAPQPVKPVSLKDFATKKDEEPDNTRYNQIESYVEQLEKSSRLLQAEFDTLGKSNAERQKAIELGRIGTVADQDQLQRITAAVDANEALRSKIEAVKKAEEGLKQAATAAGDAISDGLADALIDGKGVQEIIDGLIKQFARLAIQAALMGSGSLGGLTGGNGGLFGALASGVAGMFGGGAGFTGSAVGAGGVNSLSFGGPRAKGGPIDPGKYYLAGELGPELIAPRSPGTVIPSGALGTTHVNTTVNVSVTGSAGGPKDNEDLAKKIGASVRDEMRAVAAKELRQQLRPGGLLNGMR